MSEAFYRKWRPRQWGEVVAQEHIVQTLQNAVKAGRVGHAYLFAGPRGTGKTTTARLLAKAVNCLDDDLTKRPCNQCAHCLAVNENRFLDLIEIDAASNTSVEDVRDLRDKINFAPTLGKYKVYIIDEVHMLSTAAFNALLKTLEEPPAHAIFILATTEIHKIPATVLSRCQRHEFRRIPVAQIASLLREKAAGENLLVDEDAILLIARQATGSMRDAISLLDQLSSTGQHVSLGEAQQVLGTATSQMVIDLTQAILSGDSTAGLAILQSALDSGTDSRQFARQQVEYLRNLLLLRMNSGDQVEATPEIRTIMAGHARNFGSGNEGTARLMEAIRLFNQAASDTRGGWHPGLQLELALVGSILPPGTTAPQSVVTASTNTHQSIPAPMASGKSSRIESNQASENSSGKVEGTPRATPQPSTTVNTRVAQSPASGQTVSAKPTNAVREGSPTAKEVSSHDSPVKSPPPSDSSQVEQLIRERWDDIRKTVKQNASLQGLLNTSKIHSIREGFLILSITSDILKSKLEAADNLKIISQAIQNVVGIQIAIKVITSSAKSLDITEDTSSNLVNAAVDLGGKMVYKE